MGYKSQVSYQSGCDLLSRLSCQCFRRLPGVFGDSLVLLATPRCFRRLSGAFGDSPVHSAPGRCIWRLPVAFGDSRATSQFTCFPDAFLRFLELRIGGYQWLMPSQGQAGRNTLHSIPSGLSSQVMPAESFPFRKSRVCKAAN